MSMPESTNVIKSNAKTSGVLKNRTLEAEREAAIILSEAREKASKILSIANEKAFETLTAARDQGRNEALVEMESLLLDAMEFRDRAFSEAERELLGLAVRLAEKILGTELEQHREKISDVVSSALQYARQKENLVIRVNPADLPFVQDKLDAFKSISQARFIDVSADPTVETGGCLIESEVGTVDAQIKTQLRVLEKALLAKAEGEFVAD